MEDIAISESGLNVLGFPIGLNPTPRDFELAFEGEVVRSNPTATKGRQLRICDSKGLLWLIDSNHDVVLSFHIRLAPLRYRELSESDPSGSFKGKVRIAQYTVFGPFSFDTGEIVRKVTIPGLSLSFLPDEKRIRGIGVAFVENEKKLTQ